MTQSYPKGKTPSAKEALPLVLETEDARELVSILARMGEHYLPWLIRSYSAVPTSKRAVCLRVISRTAPAKQATKQASKPGQAQTFLLERMSEAETPIILREAVVQLGKLGESDLVASALTKRLKVLDGAAHGLRPELLTAEKRAIIEALGKVGGSKAAALLAARPQEQGLASSLEEGAMRARRTAARKEDNLDIQLGDGVLVTFLCRAMLAELLHAELIQLGAPKDQTKVVDGTTVACPFSQKLLKSRLYTELRVPAKPAKTLAADQTQRTPKDTDTLDPELLESWITSAVRAAKSFGPKIRYRLAWWDGSRRKTWTQLVAKGLDASDSDRFLNDPMAAPWELYVDPIRGPLFWKPRVGQDRFPPGQDRIAAASHPTLAAAIVQLSKPLASDVVWDPFAGSGSELLERARYPYEALMGSDNDAKVARDLEARLSAHERVFTFEGDASIFSPGGGSAKSKINAILTNPPMGRRVRTENLEGLLTSFLTRASEALELGGRLVWLSPMPRPLGHHLRTLGMTLVSAYPVDMGGFTATLERWDKLEKTPKLRSPEAGAQTDGDDDDDEYEDLDDEDEYEDLDDDE
jgi:Putative RNA methylase family UPF0020